MRELTRARGTVEKARSAANEGWRSFSDIAGGAQGAAGPPRRCVWRPIWVPPTSLIGIIAAVSVLQALVFIGVGIAGFMMYRRVMELVNDLEARHIAPLRAKVDAILVDVKAVTARRQPADRARRSRDSGTMDRVDETAERVRDSVQRQGQQATGWSAASAPSSPRS